VRNAYKILVGKPEVKRAFGRLNVGGIKMDVMEIWWEDVD
jgi:hypothetical protein